MMGDVIECTKKCTGCEKYLSVDKFRVSRKSYAAQCSECQLSKKKKRLMTGKGRYCTSCHMRKLRDQMREDTKTKNGYSSHCKVCHSAKQRLYREKQKRRIATNNNDTKEKRYQHIRYVKTVEQGGPPIYAIYYNNGKREVVGAIE